MKKILLSFVCALGLFLSACGKENIGNLSENEVYFFYQETCPHCHDAAKYIKQNHPNLPVKSFDIKLPGNMKLFQDAVTRYNIKGVAGTPLICFGDNYIMGWGADDPKVFDIYVKPYLAKENNK